MAKDFFLICTFCNVMLNSPTSAHPIWKIYHTTFRSHYCFLTAKHSVPNVHIWECRQQDSRPPTIQLFIVTNFCCKTKVSEFHIQVVIHQNVFGLQQHKNQKWYFSTNNDVHYDVRILNVNKNYQFESTTLAATINLSRQ